MSAFYERDIPLSQLELDVNNPRHEPLNSQVEVFDWLLSDQNQIGRKVLALAQDIAQHGPNPSDRIIVVEHESSPGIFVVLEGNRRVAALKLLNNPDTAPTDSLRERFRQMSNQGYVPIRSISCIVYEEREGADHFIELKHQGESGGAGTVSWEAIQKTRHEERIKGRSRNTDALQLLSFVIEREDLFNSTLREIANSGKFPITTLQRLLDSRDFRAFLGMGKDDTGALVFEADMAEVAKALSKIIQDFGATDERRKKVGDVINQQKRSEYMAEFKPAQKVDQKKRLAAPIAPTSVEALRSRKQVSKTTAKQDSTKYVNPTDRSTIAIQGTAFAIDPTRFNRASRLFGEIRQLSLRKKSGSPVFPNAGILLVRTFIEVSVDTYIQEKSISCPSPNGWKDIKLASRIATVLDELKSSKALTSLEAKVVTKALGDPRKLAHPNSMNDMIHNLNEIPNPGDIIDIWDTYVTYLQALWAQL